MAGFNTKEQVGAEGYVTIRHFRGNIEDGNLVSEETRKNLVVTSGKVYIAKHIMSVFNAGAPDDLTRIALGSGTTAPSLSDISLQSQLDSAPFASTPVLNGNTITFIANFPPGVATGAVSEAGILTGGAIPTLFNRVVFPVKNKSPNDSFQIVWAITIV